MYVHNFLTFGVNQGQGGRHSQLTLENTAMPTIQSVLQMLSYNEVVAAPSNLQHTFWAWHHDVFHKFWPKWLQLNYFSTYEELNLNLWHQRWNLFFQWMQVFYFSLLWMLLFFILLFISMKIFPHTSEQPTVCVCWTSLLWWTGTANTSSFDKTVQRSCLVCLNVTFWFVSRLFKGAAEDHRTARLWGRGVSEEGSDPQRPPQRPAALPRRRRLREF